jgi:hypothetical protein
VPVWHRGRSNDCVFYGDGIKVEKQVENFNSFVQSSVLLHCTRIDFGSLRDFRIFIVDVRSALFRTYYIIS